MVESQIRVMKIFIVKDLSELVGSISFQMIMPKKKKKKRTPMEVTFWCQILCIKIKISCKKDRKLGTSLEWTTKPHIPKPKNQSRKQ